MESFEELADRLEQLIHEIDQLDEPLRGKVFELLDGVDAVHRIALTRLGETVGPEALDRLRSDPATAWLLDAYGIGVDQREAADAALEEIRPYVHSHGGRVEVLDADAGVVRLKLSGTCSGCTASAITLQEGIERALRERFPGFVGMEVEEEEAEPHAPPGPTLLQIEGLRR